MKAISIRQPWVWAILHCGKDVENRTWATKHRGPIALHASKNYDRDGHKYIEEVMGLSVPADLPQGGIVGVAELLDCVTTHSSRWFHGPYGWVLVSVTPLAVAPYPGKLGLMEVPDAFISSLHRPLVMADVLGRTV